MGPTGCPETSVQNYHSTLHNILDERRSHLHRGGSLKSRTVSSNYGTIHACLFKISLRRSGRALIYVTDLTKYEAVRKYRVNHRNSPCARRGLKPGPPENEMGDSGRIVDGKFRRT